MNTIVLFLNMFLIALSVQNDSLSYRKNKINIDSYDVHIYPIQFQLYDKESFWTLNAIKNIFKNNTIVFIS
jgi:hypothetical protein